MGPKDGLSLHRNLKTTSRLAVGQENSVVRGKLGQSLQKKIFLVKVGEIKMAWGCLIISQCQFL